MPATTPKPKEAPAKGNADREAPRYVRCELNKEQRTHLAQWAEEQETVDLEKWIDSRVALSHTLTIRSLDVGYQASLTGIRDASMHMNMCLIGRASTAIRALYALWYRDEVILQGQWPLTGAFDDLDF